MSKKWKAVTDLTCTFSTKSNWSQDESDSITRDVSEIRSVLPTKTSATRQISDLENIPEDGPFLLNFANIPYEADENAIKHFFQAYDVVCVTKNETKRGTGIIEFKDFNSLTGALSMTEKTFISRPIRLTIGLKEDLIRIRSGGQQRNIRFSNQQRNPPTTMSEDSDNWRTKKTQPVVSQPPTDNFSPRNDRPNWRDKPAIVRNDDNKALSENSENWRKGTNRDVKNVNFNRRNPTMQQDSTSSSSGGAAAAAAGATGGSSGSSISKPMPSLVEKSEPKDLIIKDTNKVSIFGDAKPVDTQSKDLEIEEKLAQQKKQNSDETTSKRELNVPTLSFSRGQKKQTINTPTSAVFDKVEKSENRTKTISNQPKPGVNLFQRNEQPVKPAEPVKPEPVEQIKVEPQPAPPPVNFWSERMKAKGISPQTPVNRNNSASKPGFDKSSNLPSPQPMSTEKLDPKPTTTEHHQPIANQVSDANSSVLSSQLNSPITVTTTATSATESKVSQKTPVVISVNGPFLDPKSRTPHHSMSDNSSNKTPTAVPINKSSPSDTVESRSLSKPLSSAILLSSSSPLSSSSELQQSKPTNTPINACGKQSSWAKGPPKGLLEKTEINQ